MPPSSNAFVPSVAGLIMAGHVINELLKDIKIYRVGDDD
jgi:tRNA A37 threonylcarbamoyladenosine dehydratase